MRRAEISDLERRFPGVHAWFGFATRSWWAFVPFGEWGWLVEAERPAHLADRIVQVRGGRRQ